MDGANTRVPTIVSTVIERILQYGMTAGIARAVLLRRAGLTESAFEDATGRLPITCAFALMEFLSDTLGEPAVAMSIARSARVEDMRVLGFALMTASDGREALDRLVAFSRLITDSGEWSWTEQDERVEVRWQRRGAKSKGWLLSNELAIAVFVQHVRAAAPDFAPLRVTFAHEGPRDLSPYRDFFRCPVRFGARHDGLAFPLTFLSERPRAESPALGAFLGRMAEAAANDLIGAEDPLAPLRAAIRHELAEGAPQMSRVASRMGTSERTLRRRLEQEGTSFRDVVDGVRRAWAEELLAGSELSVTEIALRLGFSEGPAFSRAFRRWTGQPPLAFRQRPRSPRAEHARTRAPKRQSKR